MERYNNNLVHLELVADALKDVLDEVTFVGGCTTILLVDAAASGGVRQTDDVDIIVDVATLQEYQAFGKKLRAIGFREDQHGPICRWKKKSGESEIKLDVMPNSKEILGFSNRWYADAMRSSEMKALPSGVKIKVVSPGYFLATKFEAFLGRGKGDHAGSHDLEDIVFVLENRTGLVRELIDYPHKLKAYLAGQARNLLNDKFLYVLPGLVSNSGGQHAVEGYLKIISKWGK